MTVVAAVDPPAAVVAAVGGFGVRPLAWAMVWFIFVTSAVIIALS